MIVGYAWEDGAEIVLIDRRMEVPDTSGAPVTVEPGFFPRRLDDFPAVRPVRMDVRPTGHGVSAVPGPPARDGDDFRREWVVTIDEDVPPPAPDLLALFYSRNPPTAAVNGQPLAVGVEYERNNWFTWDDREWTVIRAFRMDDPSWTPENELRGSVRRRTGGPA